MKSRQQHTSMDIAMGLKKGIEIGLRKSITAQPERMNINLRVEKISKHQSDFSDLDAEKWTPCYDPSKLPKNMSLWATFDGGDGYRYVDKIFYDMTEWSRDVSNVIAYMEYEEPKPYGGEE